MSSCIAWLSEGPRSGAFNQQALSLASKAAAAAGKASSACSCGWQQLWLPAVLSRSFHPPPES